MLSVVIPTFNRAQQVRRAVESVWVGGRGRTPCEVIVVDDGSTDATTEVLVPYVRRRLARLVRLSENRGVGAARNVGVRAARGKVVVLLDSDDRLLPGALVRIARWFEQESDLDVLFGQTVCEGQPMGRVPAGRVAYEDLLRWDPVGEYLPAVRRNVLLAQPFEEDLRGFEGLTWWAIARAGARIRFDDKPVRLYDARGCDRLCTPARRVSDAALLLTGYRRLLERFGDDLLRVNPVAWERAVLRVHGYAALAGVRPAPSDPWPRTLRGRLVARLFAMAPRALLRSVALYSLGV